jgi:hypothetical protein
LINVPRATISEISAELSDSEPSHQCTAFGSQSCTSKSTQAFIAPFFAAFFVPSLVVAMTESLSL